MKSEFKVIVEDYDEKIKEYEKLGWKYITAIYNIGTKRFTLYFEKPEEENGYNPKS